MIALIWVDKCSAGFPSIRSPWWRVGGSWRRWRGTGSLTD